MQTAAYSTGTVTSKDGSIIGYKQTGAGPGLILVHGGMMASQNFTKLGALLADAFTVYIPDRRGRGMSEQDTKEYGLAKESEDMQALVQITGAQNIFGLSSGAIIALQTALTEPSIKKLALYEPPLPFTDGPSAWVPAYDKAMKEGDYGEAMASVVKGTGDESMLAMTPKFMLTAMFNMAIKKEEVAEGQVSLKTLIAAMYHDIAIVNDSQSLLDTYQHVAADTLLLGGTRSIQFLRENVDIMSAAMPHAKRIIFEGLGHVAADNNGKPEIVANALKEFFAS